MGKNIIEYCIIIKVSGIILFLKLLTLSLCNCFLTVVGVSFQQSEYTSSESTPVRVCVLITDGSVQRNVVFSVTGQENGSATGNAGMPSACHSVVRILSISVLRMCCYEFLHM